MRPLPMDLLRSPTAAPWPARRAIRKPRLQFRCCSEFPAKAFFSRRRTIPNGPCIHAIFTSPGPSTIIDFRRNSFFTSQPSETSSTISMRKRSMSAESGERVGAEQVETAHAEEVLCVGILNLPHAGSPLSQRLDRALHTGSENTSMRSVGTTTK